MSGALFIAGDLSPLLINLRHRRGLIVSESGEGDESAPITLFVDSVSGDDGNDGRAAGAALATLGAALDLAEDGEVIGLARGSFWREEMDLTGLVAPTVKAYGTGSPPRITGADIIAGWSLVGGTTNVYGATITHDAGGSNRLRVYEDGGLLERVLTEEECDGQAGSFVILVGSDGSPSTLKIHPSDSIDPTVNGKVYEVTVRTHVIAGGPNCTVMGIETERAISNNGSADLGSHPNGRLERVIASDGSKHNLGIGSGVMRDCIAYHADDVTALEASNTAFVAFIDDGRGQSAAVIRCGLIGPAPGADFTAHGNTYPMDSAFAEQLWVYQTLAFASAWTSNVGSFYKGVNNFPGGGGGNTKLLVDIRDNGSPCAPGQYLAETAEDCVIVKRQSTNFNPVFQPSGTYAAVYSHLSMFNETSFVAGNPTFWVSNGTADMELTVNFCVMFNGAGLMMIPSGGVYVGDHNVFIAGYPGDSTTPVHFHHYALSWITNLAAWQAGTGQDTNSVYLERADQTPGNANAFWLGVALGLNNGPLDGDWRVNSNARVFDGANVAHIGQFPDGVPITQAGARNHWDWDARASAAGPPMRWPVVPSNLSEARTYINNPTDWSFYP